MYVTASVVLSFLVSFFVLPLFFSISKRVFATKGKRYTANMIVLASAACFVYLINLPVTHPGL